jgi:hypothetical protein
MMAALGGESSRKEQFKLLSFFNASAVWMILSAFCAGVNVGSTEGVGVGDIVGVGAAAGSFAGLALGVGNVAGASVVIVGFDDGVLLWIC